jgi:hypothetical protein
MSLVPCPGRRMGAGALLAGSTSCQVHFLQGAFLAKRGGHSPFDGGRFRRWKGLSSPGPDRVPIGWMRRVDGRQFARCS